MPRIPFLAFSAFLALLQFQRAEAADPPPVPSPAPSPVPSPAAPSVPALKPEDEALAQKHYAAGEQAFIARRYEQALNDFTTSYEISKQPDLLYNLHKVAIKLGQKEMAIGYLREYMRYRPAEAEATQKEIDRISAAEIKPEPPEPPAPPPPPPIVVLPAVETPRGTPRAAGPVLMGVGGAALVAGAALLGAMFAIDKDAADPADLTRQRAMLVSGSFLAATGAVALVGGIVLFRRSRANAPIALFPSGAGARLSATF